MSKLTWVCGVSLALAFLTGACSSDDDTTPAPSGGSGGRAGATGTAGRAGSGGSSGHAGAAQGGGTSEAGEPGVGGAGDEAGAGGAETAGSAGAGEAGASEAGSGGQAGAANTADVCLPDGTTLGVTATSTASAYVISDLPAAWSDGAGDNNATLTLCRGFTYTFAIAATGHPFYFKTTRVLGATSAYDTGVTNNGVDTGTISFTVPNSAPDALFYQCAVHTAMGGDVTIVDAP